MKKAVLCFIVFGIGLLTACGGNGGAPQSVPVSQTQKADEFALPEDLSGIAAAETLDDADVTCVPLERDGKMIGFEMRLLQSAKLDTLFSSEENYYYGAVLCGKKQIGVPMEQIRILTDSGTHEFVLTMLLPTGQTVSGKTCTVSFYVAKRADDASNALFCASKAVSLL